MYMGDIYMPVYMEGFTTEYLDDEALYVTASLGLA